MQLTLQFVKPLVYIHKYIIQQDIIVYNISIFIHKGHKEVKHITIYQHTLNI